MLLQQQQEEKKIRGEGEADEGGEEERGTSPEEKPAAGMGLT